MAINVPRILMFNLHVHLCLRELWLKVNHLTANNQHSALKQPNILPTLEGPRTCFQHVLWKKNSYSVTSLNVLISYHLPSRTILILTLSKFCICSLLVNQDSYPGWAEWQTPHNLQTSEWNDLQKLPGSECLAGKSWVLLHHTELWDPYCYWGLHALPATKTKQNKTVENTRVFLFIPKKGNVSFFPHKSHSKQKKWGGKKERNSDMKQR